MNTFTQAMRFAIDAHGEARRKGDGTPMILHAMESAAIAATLTDDQEVLAAAVLHDTVEDAGVSIEEICERFGARVARLVGSETENKRWDTPPEQTWRTRKEESIATLLASNDRAVSIVFLADKLSNMRSFYREKQKHGDAIWKGFNQKDPAQHHWYYRRIADALSQFARTCAWQEYDWLIRQVFDEERRAPGNPVSSQRR